MTDEDRATTSDPRLLASVVLDRDSTRDHHGSDDDGLRAAEAALKSAAEPEATFKDVMSAGGRMTLGLLFGLAVIDSVDNAMFTVFAPDIRESLRISSSAVAVVGALAGVMVSLGALPLGSLGDRFRRTFIAGLCTLGWAVAAAGLGLVQALWQLVIVRIIAGLGKANEGPIQGSLLVDTYPPAGRGRVFAVHRSALPLGIVLGPVLAGAVAVAVPGDRDAWRWAFAVLAVPGVILALGVLRLPEPTRGRFEQEALLGGELPPDPDALPVTLAAAFARLKKIRTFYFVMAALGAFGLCVTTVPIYLSLILEDHFGQGVEARGMIGAVTALGGLIGAALGGVYSDRLFRRSPEACLYMGSGALAALGVGFGVQAYAPNVTIYVVVGLITSAILFFGLVPLTLVVASVTPTEFRATAFALVGLYLALVGGLGGALVTGLAEESWGARAAIAVVAPAASVLAGVILASSAGHLRGDIARAAADLLEERTERLRLARGDEMPLLQVSHLDFSYGPVQVLFDVSLEVRQGETLALLGTNGAGKSSLLRVISGLEYADRGAVRISGRTVTYADPATRVKLGIVQVPGGRSVYPNLSVSDNLLIGGYTLLGDSRNLEQRAHDVLERFPLLRQRLDQPAGTLSGGEQQMLGLATAMLLRPEILLIDELSLGLSPVMVQEVLAIVDGLKAEGLTMVIVEQSVKIALSIADRAVFMEKGQVRFEGPAHELAHRDDLVRAVFLGKGAGA
ncbi:MFS transporter [Dactylosporangium sp. CA-233914]|uniref:MFS transporter n=1 Tax=Dactylosporangium sp. CA-233914 TaxID=3239934 RepID=UPI003D8C7828